MTCPSAVNGETSNKETQDKVSAALPALLAEAQVKRTVFETVLNRYQTRLSEHGFSEPTAAIVSRAMPPAQASFPRTSLFLAVGAFVALLTGIAAALLMQMLRPRSMSLNAVADAIGVRPLVAIPRFRNESRRKGVVKIRDPRMYIECIRSMRHAIFEQQSARDTRVCLFTSVVPSQGKTLVAMSLARALARSGTRTLFLEMDLRCPAASPLAHLPETSYGIGAVLEGRAQFTEVLQHDETTGLEMLLAEKNAAFALDRVTVASFSALIAKLRKFYDAIIVDSPPGGRRVRRPHARLRGGSDRDRRAQSRVDAAGSARGNAIAPRTRRDARGPRADGRGPRDLALAGKRMDRYVVGMQARLALVKQAG